MKLPTNAFLSALRSGTPQIGLWISLASNVAAEVVADAGFDWVLLDMEHSPNELPVVLSQLQVFASRDTTAIVRPQWNDPVLVKRLLDVGAEGLLFPMVQNATEADAAVAATRYPPRGIRGVSGTTRANRFGRIGDYFSRVEDETAVLLQVETREALATASEIGERDGVDGVFFGPADISASLGHLGQPMHPETWDLIRATAKPLMDRGVPVGTLVFDPALARQLIDEGFSFVACGSDLALLARGADALHAAMR
ncbi:MAG: aldolase/citrate lyase family protein [Pseudomonadota bacterium]